MKNGDAIRAMSDEELAKYMDLTRDNAGCPNYGDCSDTCEECWLKWLEQEVDDGIVTRPSDNAQGR